MIFPVVRYEKNPGVITSYSIHYTKLYEAFCALIFGSGTSLVGIILQRNWSSYVYPWLQDSGNLTYVNSLFAKVTELCSPLVVWEMSAVKFPINSYEIYFLAMMFGCGAYIIGSMITYRKPYNLDRMLHRGAYSENGIEEKTGIWTWKNIYKKLVGIDKDYTTGDKVIAWSVFGYSIGLQFVIRNNFV